MGLLRAPRLYTVPFPFAASHEAARVRRNEGWAYSNDSDGNQALSSQRLCAPSGNPPPPHLRAMPSPNHGNAKAT